MRTRTHHWAPPALPPMVADLSRAADADEADATNESTEEVRTAEERGDIAEGGEGEEHADEMDLVARLDGDPTYPRHAVDESF